jgi:hypothetical protein
VVVESSKGLKLKDNEVVVESSKGLKLKDNEVEWLLEDLFDPLDFLSIMGYSNDYEDWREYITKFYGRKYSSILHVTSFNNTLSKLNIVHEHVKINVTFIVIGNLSPGAQN